MKVEQMNQQLQGLNQKIKDSEQNVEQAKKALSNAQDTLTDAERELRDKRRGQAFVAGIGAAITLAPACLLYTSPSPRDRQKSRMPSSA